MKFTNKKYILGFSFLACLILGVVFGKSIISQFYPQTSNTISHIYMSGGIPVYAQESPAIIIGKVKKVSTPYYRKEGNVIPQQDVNIDVEEIIKGDADMKNITIVIDGGETIDKQQGGDVSFKQGEKVLLFFGKTTMGYYMPIGGPNGKYLIDENNEVSGINGFKMSLTDVRVQISDALKAPPILKHTDPVPFSGEVSPK
jgi:hypothetical protein